MDDLHIRISDIAQALEEYEAQTPASWQLAELYNALLVETQRTVPDDPIVSAMKPVAQGESGIAESDYGSLRIAVRQLEDALLAR